MTAISPNTLTLHRYHAGELDPDQAEAVRQAIERDPEVRRRYQAILAVDAEIQASPLPPQLAGLREPRRRGWLLPTAAGLGLLATAAVAVVALPGVLSQQTAVEAPYIGFKGELPDLEVWIGTSSGPRLLRPGEPVYAGDTIQLAVRAPDAAFVTLVGADSDGEVQVYGTLTIEGEGMQVAPFALVLEGGAGEQRFYALPHDEVLDDAQVLDAFEERPEDWRVIVLDLLEGVR